MKEEGLKFLTEHSKDETWLDDKFGISLKYFMSLTEEVKLMIASCTYSYDFCNKTDIKLEQIIDYLQNIKVD
jgi:hypothetical protein